MLSRIKRYFFSQAHPEYRPAMYSFFRDRSVADRIYEQGYYVADFIGESELQEISAIYEMYYQNKEKNDGAFFGEISKVIHDKLSMVLSEVLDRWFVNYKNMVSAFVVKTPGRSGRVPIHQDSASVDEMRFSNINIWIPLQSVTSVNGALHVIPRSHHIFVPYRSATIPPLTTNIEEGLNPYFTPLYLTAGQALIFDSRMIHFSPPNLSEEKRIAAICKICPQEADVIAYYKEKEAPDAQIEMWKCADDYLQYGESHNDTIRPKNCNLMTHIDVKMNPLTIEEFEKKRVELGIVPHELSDTTHFL